jgi:hypothetical protein
MPEGMKGIVPPPIQMPPELRERRSAPTRRSEVPLLIRLYTWYCFLRAFLCITFAFVEGLAPDSNLALFLASNFDSLPKQVSPEAVFFIFAFLYALIGWRFLMRDWRARWVAMFLHGAIGIRTLIFIAADHAAGAPVLTHENVEFLIAASIVNLTICAYLAFYPGMDQTFRETPWS